MGTTNSNLSKKNDGIELPDGEWSSWNSDEWVMNCPFCSRELKFTWNVVKHVGRCWVCEKTISGDFYFKKITSGYDFNFVEPIKRNREESKKETSFLCNAWDNPQARLLLISRNVSEFYSRYYSILYSDTDKTLIVETSSISEDLPKSYLWRKINNGKWFHKKGTQGKYYGIGWEKFKNSKKNVLICEGIFDLLSTKLIDKGIAVLGSHLNDAWYLWFKKNVKKLTLWFDPDEAGEKATIAISEKCLYYGIDYDIIRSKEDPKVYDRRIPSHRKFLELVEKQIESEQNSFSRRYTFGG